MGCIFSSYFAALILGVPLGSWVGDKYGWNAVFGAMSVLALVLAFSVYRLLPVLAAKTEESERKTFSVFVGRYIEFLKHQSSFGAFSVRCLLCRQSDFGFLGLMHDASFPAESGWFSWCRDRAAGFSGGIARIESASAVNLSSQLRAVPADTPQTALGMPFTVFGLLAWRPLARRERC
jgi:MFS family permease